MKDACRRHGEIKQEKRPHIRVVHANLWILLRTLGHPKPTQLLIELEICVRLNVENLNLFTSWKINLGDNIEMP